MAMAMLFHLGFLFIQKFGLNLKMRQGITEALQFLILFLSISMRNAFFATVVMLWVFLSVPITQATSHTSGYVRRNGTYVRPHFRSPRDSAFYNNWSTKGNFNPVTGKKG